MSNKRKHKNKLSESLIKEIREYYDKGFSCQKVADKFGVGKTTVRSYVDIRPRKILTEQQRKQKAVESVTKRRRVLKQKSIDYKGGKCQCCGYNKCNAALEFHHLDPNEKEFNFGSKGTSVGWEKIKKELDKCILVCSNCHREIHTGIINIDGLP